MPRPFAVHDPDAILDYGVDWAAWLNPGATIAQSSWSAPAGVTLTENGVFGATTKIRVRITDTALQHVELVNRIETSDGQQDDRTIRLAIRSR